MKYRVVIYTLEDFQYTYVQATETRTREVELYSQKIEDVNVLDVIMAVNGREKMPTTKEIMADWMDKRDLGGLEHGIDL